MIQIAILGFGVVGSGVAEVIRRNNGPIAQRAGAGFEVKYILDVRDFPDSPYAGKFVKDFAVIEQDPEVEVVVETIGAETSDMEISVEELLAGLASGEGVIRCEILAG